MKVSDLTFEQITDIKNGKPTKRKVLFLHSLKQAIIYYLKQNENTTLYEFVNNFIDEINQNDKEFVEFLEEIKPNSRRFLFKDEFTKFKKEEIKTIKKDILQNNKEIDSVWGLIGSLNDRIRILEAGRGFLDNENIKE